VNDLHVHLRNHWAAACGGVDFAERVARRHRDSEVGPALVELAGQVREDRDSLGQVMASVGADHGLLMPLAARVGERVGRLKPNGHLITRSPVSDVLELEALRGAVTTKAAGWDTLLALCDREPRLPRARLRELRERADQQLSSLEQIHRQVAAAA